MCRNAARPPPLHGPRATTSKPNKSKSASHSFRCLKVPCGYPQAQPHNLVFTKPGRRMKVFADMMRMGPRAVSSGYIPTKSRSILKSGDDVLAISLLNPGESGSVTFNAPEKPGAYPFACIYPGHQVSMYGVMHVVEDKANPNLPEEDDDSGIPPGWKDAKNAAVETTQLPEASGTGSSEEEEKE